MWCRSVNVLALLPLIPVFYICEAYTTNGWQDVHYRYHGPPAPLNHDGTVANTEEVKHATAALKAAYAHQHHLLQHAGSHDHYESQNEGEYNYQEEQYHPHHEDDGQYKPHLYEKEDNAQQEDDGQYKHHDHKSYNEEKYYKYNPEAHIPAPLNHDGTVAHTSAYKAIAAKHHSQYVKELHRHRRSAYRYHGPPAPLNHDGTVANTEEVKHATAALKAAYAHQHHLLQHAGSHDHYESQNEGEYNYQEEQYHPHHEDDGQYKPHLYEKEEDNVQQEDDGQYKHHDHKSYNEEKHYKYNPEAHIPAPLNHDGTVAHTSAYKAIAAKHHSQYEKELTYVIPSFSDHSMFGY